MSIIISSANGPLVNDFLIRNNVYSEIEEIDEYTKEQQFGLAGPNDNIQFILDWGPLAKAVIKYAIDHPEFSLITLERLYNYRKDILQSVGKHTDKLIKLCSSLVSKAPQ